MRLREVVAGGAALTLREWGEPGRTAFLFWHSVGPLGSGAMLDPAAAPLVDAGFHVIAPDAPGFGRSPALDADAYSVERLAELMWTVADTLDLERPILAGHSWGGAVAVTACGLRPERVRALVLYDSGHCDYADWPGADLTATRDEMIQNAASEDTEVASWEELLDLLRAEDLVHEWTLPACREAVEVQPDGRVRLRMDTAARGAALYELTHARASAAWPAIAAAEIPTLLLLATKPDDVRDANEKLVPRFAAAVPHAEILRPGCRHAVFADLGAKAGELVVDWLQQRDVS
jgi:pimeloyl-ACP methyl ester carboxylesterase